MKQRLRLLMVATFLLALFLFLNSVAMCFEKRIPTRIPENQIASCSFEFFEKSGTYCEIFNDFNSPAYYYGSFDSVMGFAVFMDPAQCGESPYPFEITDVHFYLYDAGSFNWPVAIRVNIKDSNEGDSCSGPGDVLCSEDFSVDSDSAYPLMMILSLTSPCSVSDPFFLEIMYTEPRDPDHPHPSLLMDTDAYPADTCHNWALGLISPGMYTEWYEVWTPPTPGDAIIRATGYVVELCTTVTFTHLDSTYVPWAKINQSTDNQPLLGFRIDCVQGTDYLESVTIKSFIQKAFSIEKLKLWMETGGGKGLQTGSDTPIAEVNIKALVDPSFDSNDTLKISGLHRLLKAAPDSNLFYITIDAWYDTVNVAPSLYNGQCLEVIIEPGRIVSNSGETNPDTVYNRPDWTASDPLMTGFIPGSPPNGRYRLCFDTTPCTDLPLHSGWQWVSTNMNPNPCKMESVFTKCWNGYLDIIIACDGSFCIPGVGCWIDCWNVLEMYNLHIAEACTIQVCGSKIPTETPILLAGGVWNCIAYFPDCPLEPETALVSIWDNLDIVKNDAGEFCIPGVGCWIECMEYNEGYKLHLSSADTLIYPAVCPPCQPPFAKKNNFLRFAQTTHFNYIGNTGESYSIVVSSINLSGKHPDVGDEIGIFTPSGLCVGGGVWQGGILGMAAWQDDDHTKILDGFKIGEQMQFKLWDKSSDTEIELEPQFEEGRGKFGKGPYVVVSLKGSSSALPKAFFLGQNHPNPFNPTTVIKFALPVDCHVKVVIYNILGQKVKTLVDDYQNAGYKTVEWDGKNDKGEEVTSGIYFYRIKAGEFTESNKMVILK